MKGILAIGCGKHLVAAVSKIGPKESEDADLIVNYEDACFAHQVASGKTFTILGLGFRAWFWHSSSQDSKQRLAKFFDRGHWFLQLRGKSRE